MQNVMRSEAEMMRMIVETAKADERIRAVYMNGSRTNLNAVRDCFQDYDIVYVVTDTKPFYSDPDWIRRFGTILLMQMPEYMDCLLGKEYHPEQSITGRSVSESRVNIWIGIYRMKHGSGIWIRCRSAVWNPCSTR